MAVSRPSVAATIARWRKPPRFHRLGQPSPATIFRSRSFAVAGGCYLAVLMVMFWPLLAGSVLHAGAATSVRPPFVSPDSVDAVPHVMLMEGDFVEQFAEFEQYQYDAARQGRFPTWNPQIYMGQPFHGDGQSAMFDPFHWVYFLVDPNTARGPMAMLRLWVSAVGTFALLRRFGLVPSAAFVGGAAYTFGSFNLHWLMWPQSNATLWLPVVLLSLEFLVVRPTLAGFSLAGLAVAPLFLSGHPGTILLCGLVIGVFAAVRWVGLARSRWTAQELTLSAAAAVGAVTVGAVVASVALLPLAAQIRRSFDYLDPAGRRGTTDTLPWKSLWLFLVPESFGRPRGFYPGNDFTGPLNYIEDTFWFGGLALALAVAGLAGRAVMAARRPTDLWRRRPSALMTVAVALLVLVIPAVFTLWPLYGLMSAMPGMGLTSLRRLFFALHLAGAILAAIAVDRVVGRRDRTMAAVGVVATTAAAVTAVWATAARWPDVQQKWAAMLAALPQLAGAAAWPKLVVPMAVQFSGVRMVVGDGLLVLGTATVWYLGWAAWRRRAPSPAMRYLFAAIVVADVLLPGVDLNPIAPRNLAVPAAPPLMRTAIAQAGSGRMAATDWTLPPNLSMQYGFRDVRGYDLPHDQRLVDVYRRLHIDGLDQRGLLTTDHFYPSIEPAFAAYFDRTCLKELLAVVPGQDAASGLWSLHLRGSPPPTGGQDWQRTGATGDGLMVFENPNAYPRAFLAKSAVRAGRPADGLDALLDPDSDLRDRTVYEGNVPPPADAADPPGGTTVIRVDEPERVVLDCLIPAAPASGRLLVLEDRMADGWTVRVDDVPATPLTANYLFRGAVVPPGQHTVAWTYSAPGLMAGTVLSALSVAVLIGLLVVPPAVRFRRRRRGRIRWS